MFLHLFLWLAAAVAAVAAEIIVLSLQMNFLLPGISSVPTTISASATSAKIYVNDLPNTQHERWFVQVERLHPDKNVLINDFRRDDTEDTFNVFNNYYAQQSDTITVLPRGYEKPYLMVRYLEQTSRRQSVNYNNLGLLVISAGNAGISFTENFDQDVGDRNGFLELLNRKRTIIAVGLGENGRREDSSNYCEDWYVQFCVGAAYHFQSDRYVLGTSFLRPLLVLLHLS